MWDPCCHAHNARTCSPSDCCTLLPACAPCRSFETAEVCTVRACACTALAWATEVLVRVVRFNVRELMTVIETVEGKRIYIRFYA